MEQNLYYCSICDQDTLHDTVNINRDSLTVRCNHCDTTAVVEAENFHNYEEVAMEWDSEIRAMLDSFEE